MVSCWNGVGLTWVGPKAGRSEEKGFQGLYPRHSAEVYGGQGESVMGGSTEPKED